MFSADFIKHFFIYRLPVYRLAFSLELLYHCLHHFTLKDLLAGHALCSFAESAPIFINAHLEPPMLMLHRFT